MDMNLNIKVWRQKNNTSKGQFETYPVKANEHMSFLEMLDVLNEDLVNQKKEPIAFEHDCRAVSYTHLLHIYPTFANRIFFRSI